MTQNVVLVNQSSASIDLDTLALALERQVHGPFGQAYGTVHVHGESVYPAWRVTFKDQLAPGEGGVHLDNNGVPYALVLASEGSVAASHELLEMIADPWGVRFAATPNPSGKQGDVFTLIEVCDPVEVTSYTGFDGVELSDYVFPAYYQTDAAGPYSYKRAATKPLHVNPGGYISWWDPADYRWHQILPDGKVVTASQATAPTRAGKTAAFA